MKVWQHLIRTFDQKASEGISPIDLADATWLAAHWEQSNIIPDSILPGHQTESKEARFQSILAQEAKPPQKPIHKISPPSPAQKLPPSLNEENKHLPVSEDHRLELRLPPKPSPAESGEKILCPNPPALTDKHEIAKAFQVLNQRVLSRLRYVIDEKATVDFIATA